MNKGLKMRFIQNRNKYAVTLAKEEHGALIRQMKIIHFRKSLSASLHTCLENCNETRRFAGTKSSENEK